MSLPCCAEQRRLRTVARLMTSKCYIMEPPPSADGRMQKLKRCSAHAYQHCQSLQRTSQGLARSTSPGVSVYAGGESGPASASRHAAGIRATAIFLAEQGEPLSLNIGSCNSCAPPRAGWCLLTSSLKLHVKQFQRQAHLLLPHCQLRTLIKQHICVLSGRCRCQATPATQVTPSNSCQVSLMGRSIRLSP